jgi:hypothetical protein
LQKEDARMNAQMKFDNVDDMLKEAEDTFRKGVGTLSSWSEQARELIDNKPSVILAAIGVSGFVMGSLLRHGISSRKAIRSGESISKNTLPGFSEQQLPADPFVLFVAGVVAGAVAGPRVIREALSGIDRFASQGGGGSLVGLETNRTRAASGESRDQRPFEKL